MNQLKMDIQQTISTLSRSGWSQRRIARELGIDRETVARYRGLARQTGGPEPAIPPAGSEPVAGPNPAIVPPGSEVARVPSGPGAGSSNPAISPTGPKSGRVSQCEPFESFIKEGLDGGLSAQRIYQDLVSEQKFTGGYDSVKRFVRQLGVSLTELAAEDWRKLLAAGKESFSQAIGRAVVAAGGSGLLARSAAVPRGVTVAIFSGVCATDHLEVVEGAKLEKLAARTKG